MVLCNPTLTSTCYWNLSHVQICGEASSHCVNCTTIDIIMDWEKFNKEHKEKRKDAKLYILRDCTCIRAAVIILLLNYATNNNKSNNNSNNNSNITMTMLVVVVTVYSYEFFYLYKSLFSSFLIEFLTYWMLRGVVFLQVARRLLDTKKTKKISTHSRRASSS